jgi:hypothetical protein
MPQAVPPTFYLRAILHSLLFVVVATCIGWTLGKTWGGIWGLGVALIALAVLFFAFRLLLLYPSELEKAEPMPAPDPAMPVFQWRIAPRIAAVRGLQTIYAGLVQHYRAATTLADKWKIGLLITLLSAIVGPTFVVYGIIYATLMSVFFFVILALASTLFSDALVFMVAGYVLAKSLSLSAKATLAIVKYNDAPHLEKPRYFNSHFIQRGSLLFALGSIQFMISSRFMLQFVAFAGTTTSKWQWGLFFSDQFLNLLLFGIPQHLFGPLSDLKAVSPGAHFVVNIHRTCLLFGWLAIFRTALLQALGGKGALWGTKDELYDYLRYGVLIKNDPIAFERAVSAPYPQETTIVGRDFIIDVESARAKQRLGAGAEEVIALLLKGEKRNAAIAYRRLAGVPITTAWTDVIALEKGLKRESERSNGSQPQVN